MIAGKTTTGFGWHVFGLGMIGLALIGLAMGNFLPGQLAPKWLPERTVLAYAVAVFMLVTGLAIEWRRTAAWGAAALTAYYVLVVVILMDGRLLLPHYAVYGVYENTAEGLAIAAGGLIVYAVHAGIDAAVAARLARVGCLAFGICALIFGGAHFVYMNLTAPLVPLWLPPSQVFWGYATGAADIAAGLAILTGVQARLAAILLAVMYACFALLVWVPQLLAAPSDLGKWSETATTVALTGVAWIVADSLSRRKQGSV